jgi:tRNA-dihydrouridine synthase 3
VDRIPLSAAMVEVPKSHLSSEDANVSLECHSSTTSCSNGDTLIPESSVIAPVVHVDKEKASISNIDSNTKSDASLTSKAPPDDQFTLLVKQEYILALRPNSLGPLPVPSSTGSTDENGKGRKREKGMNKKRPRDVRQPDCEKLCLFLVKGEPCPHKENCKFSHDVQEYLRTKPSDLDTIPGGCPSFRVHGICRYGICCRLAGTHTSKDGENLTSDTVTEVETTKNVLDRDTLTLLRKNQYPFHCPRNPFQNKEMPEKVRKLFSAPLPKESPRKTIDFRGKVYVAPLTTVGNLPFRRIMKKHGADITCGEMAVATCLLEGKHSEWSLVKRHVSEDVFGVQLAAAHPDQFVRAAELLEKHVDMDFVDLNLGCPLDILCNKGAGAHLMLREKRLKESLIGLCNTLSVPITIKMRTGWDMAKPIAHKLVPHIQSWGVDGVATIFIHGRSRLQRYCKDANWDYIAEVSKSQSSDYPKIPIVGNGDIFSFTDYEEKVAREGVEATAMLARGALIKPWLPMEIKERRHWDISASERLDILKDFCTFGLEHWGSDQQGVNTTRRFLLEWLSFLCRYVPVGLLERVPQQMNQRPPTYIVGRSDLETLFLSTCSYDWIKISEMLLGPVPDGFEFEPKHKANAYAK